MSMTENEKTISVLKHTKNIVNGHIEEALTMAIQAFEEIQQYRAIGTVEEFKALKEKENSINKSITFLEKRKAKIIDEFISELYKIGEHREFDWEDIYKLADQLKGEQE